MDETQGLLVERARSGEPAAIDSLIERHLPALRAFVRLRASPRLREQESTSDLVQSVCRELLQDLGNFQYQGEAAFRAWLYQAAERKLIDRVRYHRRDKRDTGRKLDLPEGASVDERTLNCYASFCTPSQEAIAREQLERIEAAFDRLSESERRVIVLARIVGLPGEEVAREIGQTPAYTRTVLSRALARLSTHLDRRQA